MNKLQKLSPYKDVKAVLQQVLFLNVFNVKLKGTQGVIVNIAWCEDREQTILAKMSESKI